MSALGLLPESAAAAGASLPGTPVAPATFIGALTLRVITYDIEIETDPLAHPRKWEGARRGDCGLASMVLYDTDSGRYHVYDRRTLAAGIAHLNSADLLVSFNGVEFDTPCLEGVSGIPILADQFDICQAVWKACGRRHKGYGLGPICERTLGIAKSGTGEHAPKLYQENRWAELIDYNMNDVHMTRTLFNHLVDSGYIVAHDDSTLEVSVPRGAYA